MEFTVLCGRVVAAGGKTLATGDLYNATHAQKPSRQFGHCYSFSSFLRRFHKGLCRLFRQDTECAAGHV